MCQEGEILPSVIIGAPCDVLTTTILVLSSMVQSSEASPNIPIQILTRWVSLRDRYYQKLDLTLTYVKKSRRCCFSREMGYRLKYYEED